MRELLLNAVDDLPAEVAAIVRDVGMSGVVRIDLDGRPAVELAVGFAHRGLGIANTAQMQFGTASGAKSFTALTVMTMVERGELSLGTTARSLLGDDLPLIDGRVTVEHLLRHRSGIGDYFDEEAFTDPLDYPMPIPVHRLATTEDFLQVLDGHPMVSVPGERFTYNNGAYVVLALLAERAAGRSFHDLVHDRVCVPAGMTDTAFLRSDELPGTAALGYLEADGLRTNVLHLPVRGSGDGGVYTTAADIHTLWDALFDGRVVSPATLATMTRAPADVPAGEAPYGLGFWLDGSSPAVSMHGFDAGIGFVSTRDPGGRYAVTVLCNQTRGAWPTSERLLELVTARS